MSALFPGLFPNAQEHSNLRLRLNRTEPASGALLTLRTAENARLRTSARGEFPEGASLSP